jgi:hypothetical protein
VATAAGAAALTVLSQIMRSVLDVGGSCADGGAYVSDQSCPQGTGTALLLVLGCGVACLVAGLWGAVRVDAPLPLFLAWPALFFSLAWDFLEYGLMPPSGQGAIGGLVLCGVLFALLGGIPLLAAVAALRKRRSGRTAGDDDVPVLPTPRPPEQATGRTPQER